MLRNELGVQGFKKRKEKGAVTCATEFNTVFMKKRKNKKKKKKKAKAC